MFERAGTHFIYGVGIVLIVVGILQKTNIAFVAGIFSLALGSILLASEQ